jgi:hypothetical protein
MSQQVTDDDWRLQGQERYLSNATVYWRPWHQSRPNWDHDPCFFCWAKFMDRADVQDVLREGYTTDDEYHGSAASALGTWLLGSRSLSSAARLRHNPPMQWTEPAGKGRERSIVRLTSGGQAYHAGSGAGG